MPVTSDRQSEMLDVVDEQDRIIETRTRSDIHRLGLRHRAAHILLFNSDNKLFIQKRSMSKDNSPGLWDSSCAGHVDAGESYVQCAVRELQEELGLVISSADIKESMFLNAEPSTGMEFSTVYTLFSDAPLLLDPVEIDAGEWFSANAVTEWMETHPEELTEIFRLIWARYSSLNCMPFS